MIGKTLGHYRIVGKLSKGGMGEVYVAEDAKLDRKVALKVLPGKMAENPERRQRFVARSIVDLDPFQIGGYHLVAYLSFRAGRVNDGERVIEDFEETAASSRNAEKDCMLALLRAERLLARGKPAEARAETERLSRERCPFSWLPVPQLNARAYVAEDNSAAAIAAYREIVDRHYPRPALEIDMRIPALFELARLEERQGDRASAREHYREYLGYWGEADVAIPEVAEAKKRLARLDAP